MNLHPLAEQRSEGPRSFTNKYHFTKLRGERTEVIKTKFHNLTQSDFTWWQRPKPSTTPTVPTQDNHLCPDPTSLLWLPIHGNSLPPEFVVRRSRLPQCLYCWLTNSLLLQYLPRVAPQPLPYPGDPTTPSCAPPIDVLVPREEETSCYFTGGKSPPWNCFCRCITALHDQGHGSQP